MKSRLVEVRCRLIPILAYQTIFVICQRLVEQHLGHIADGKNHYQQVGYTFSYEICSVQCLVPGENFRKGKDESEQSLLFNRGMIS